MDGFYILTSETPKKTDLCISYEKVETLAVHLVE